MSARRLTSLVGTTLVGVIAGAASYAHMRAVAVATGQGTLIGTLLPLSVDGLILVATLAIGDGRTSTLTAWLAFSIGVAASLAANIAAAEPSPAARIVSAWPSVAFLLSVEVLLRHRRTAAPLTVPASEPTLRIATTRHDDATTTSGTKATAVIPTARSIATTPVPRTSTGARIAAARRRWPDATIVQIAAKADVSESTARRHLAHPPPPDDGTLMTPPNP